MTNNSYKTGIVGEEYLTLGIADAGVYATAYNKWAPDRPSSITIYDRRLEAYYGDLAEGGLVLDKRPCRENDEFIKRVVCGPMHGQHLPSKTRDSWGKHIPCESAKEASGFDLVSTDLYLSYWRELGAKIGYRKGNYIEWENGEKDEIPSEEDRWKC